METVKNKADQVIGYREKIYVNGKSISKTFKTKTHAKQWKREKLAERDKLKALGLKQNSSITFKEFFQKWIASYKNGGNAQRTIDSYTGAYRNYLKSFDKKLLTEISAEDGYNLLDSLSITKLSVTRKNYILRVFKTILNRAEEREYIIKNPLKRVKFLKEEYKVKEFWNVQEVSKFLKANKESEHYELFVVALNTGMRRGELCGLCWDSVNFKRNVIQVRRTRDRYELKETTKTGKTREVPINHSTRSVLEDLFKQQRNLKYVFAKKSGEPLNVRHISDQLLKRAIKNAGVKEITFHSLRRTMASNFVMAGGDLQSLARILGHQNIEITVNKYAHLHPSYLQESSNTINFSADTQNDSPHLARKVLSLDEKREKVQ